MKYRMKSSIIEAITFDELVQHGLKYVESNPDQGSVRNGMPWHFEYMGHHITHENDDCYIVPTPKGSLHFKRGDMLVIGAAGDLYPWATEVFDATYVMAEMVSVPAPRNLREALQRAVNAHSAENGCNTPDFILAEYLEGCLAAFDHAVNARSDWYGRRDTPGGS
jgi:hypothetical protein